jgi:anti-sigma B factor antagonist
MEKNIPRIKVTQDNGVSIVELLDEEILDEGTISVISESLFAVVDDHAPVQLLLSFFRVKHLSSSALGTLIRLNKHIDETGGKLKLCEIKKNLYEIFSITKLNKLFDIYEDRDTALKSFTQ